MATIDETIEAELESKSIEKEPSLSLEINEEDQGLSVPQSKSKKSKKVRSHAQIEAFEKARKKRAENYEKRKLLKQQEKEEKKQVKTKITEEINNLSTEEIKEKINKKTAKPLSEPSYVQPPLAPQSYTSYANQPPVINNYYYNTLAPNDSIPVEKRKGRKKKVVYITDSDSDEEVKEKYTSKQLSKPVEVVQPPPAPQSAKQTPKTSTRKLKYNFV